MTGAAEPSRQEAIILPDTPHYGLTSEEVTERVAAGETNAVHRRTSRPIGEILRANVFTWFNLILGVLWALMMAFGSWRDALFGFVLVFNTAIGVVQELHAKVTLDRLSLISAPRTRVVRDGSATEIGTDEVVLDDVVVLAPGDQVVVDAIVLESSSLEVDESALTGESVPVAKEQGDSVLSGSFVVAGSGTCRATAVGVDAYAMRIEAGGRRFTRTRSDVVEGINRVLKVIGVLLIPVGVLTVVSAARVSSDVPSRVTNTVAALVPMVPEGLVLLSSIAFAVSAVTLARHHALVNELPAVEGLARADVVLTDKTGTLTERDPVFGRFEPLPEGSVPVAEALGALKAISVADPAPNATIRAIAAGVALATGAASGGDSGWVPRMSVPFSPLRKWSAADFGQQGTWVLGAPDVVLDAMPGDVGAVARERLDVLSSEGSRILMLARARTASDASRTETAPERTGPSAALPEGLAPVGFVLLVETLRPDAAETVRYLGEQGVGIKIVSGDSARTVSAIAEAAGVPDAARVVDARALDADMLKEAMRENAVFGRVMPEQKSEMVAALQAGGRTVAMTGDGVNDVLALKQSDLGIAMGAGVPAARAVAQVVLLDNRFATLPVLMAEGRRVVANAERVANLFLTKTVWAMVLAVAVALVGVPYPFLPRQVTLAGSLAIGIPAFFFALAPNPRLYRPGFVGRVLRFSVPAGVVVAAVVLGGFLAARESGVSLDHARTLCTVVLTTVSLAVIVVLEWPLTGMRFGVVASMVALFALALAIPSAREFFALSVPTRGEFAVALGMSTVAVGAMAGATARVRSAVRQGQ